MPHNYRYMLVVIFLLTTLACSLVSQAVPSTQMAIPPSDTPVFTVTSIPSDTPVATDTAQPSDTPAPITPTINPALVLLTQMVGTEFAQVGPSAHLIGFLNFYSNPTGTPVESWHDVPIMKEATAGQEFQVDIYSYKAAVTLQKATSFYASQSDALHCFPPGSGSAGTGSQANHQSTFFCGPLTIVIASFDSDPSQVLVVLNKAP